MQAGKKHVSLAECLNDNRMPARFPALFSGPTRYGFPKFMPRRRSWLIDAAMSPTRAAIAGAIAMANYMRGRNIAITVGEYCRPEAHF